MGFPEMPSQRYLQCSSGLKLNNELEWRNRLLWRYSKLILSTLSLIFSTLFPLIIYTGTKGKLCINFRNKVTQFVCFPGVLSISPPRKTGMIARNVMTPRIRQARLTASMNNGISLELISCVPLTMLESLL